MLTTIEPASGGMRKRQRANTAGDDKIESNRAEFPTKELSDAIRFLDESIVRRLLLNTALVNEDLAASIFEEIENKKRIETEQEIDFSAYASHIEFLTLTGIRRDSIERIVKAIFLNLKPHSPFSNKISAFETLCRIGDVICSERLHFADAFVQHSMSALLDLTTEQERSRMHGDAWLNGAVGKALRRRLGDPMDIAGEFDLFNDLDEIYEKAFGREYGRGASPRSDSE